MALRVARGLFRLWLVLSVLWIGGVAVETWWTFPVNDWVPAPSTGGNDPKSWGAIPLEEKDGRGIAKPAFDPDQWLRDETDKERRSANESRSTGSLQDACGFLRPAARARNPIGALADDPHAVTPSPRLGRG
jgi:hypothetical protein